MLACIDGRLTADHVQISDQAAAAVVMTSPCYPAEQFPLGLPILGIDGAKNMHGVELFHHGTAVSDGQLVTARGRVLAVTAVGADLPAALANAYEAVGKVPFEGAHYRRDIGLVSQSPQTRQPRPHRQSVTSPAFAI
jgi:phosphoribosylamine--glycine ligase